MAGIIRNTWVPDIEVQARRRLKFMARLTMTLIASLGLVAAPVRAQTMPIDISASGNQFLEICSSADVPIDKATATDVRNMALCQGYMQGLGDGLGVATALLQHDNPSLASLKGSMEDFGICFPDGVNLLQTIRVTLKYIREHPEQAHLPSAALIVMAELNAFPCTNSMTGKPTTQKP